jgi:predicted PurR-regulated permease PerM
MIVFCFVRLRRAPIYPKIQASFHSNPSQSKGDLAILWALASLGRAVNSTLIAEDADSVVAQTSALIEQFEMTDTLMREEFVEMRLRFNRTKQGILANLEKSREQIREELDNFRDALVGHVMSSVASAEEAHYSYLSNASGIVREFFSTAINCLLTHSVLFFMFFQVILLFGILFYRKFERQMTLFLS